MRRELLATTALALLLAAPGLLAFPADAAAETPASGQAVPPPPTPPADPAEDPDELRRTEEVTVESASKVSSKLIDAPATMSVVTSETLASQPAQNMADTLRSVPGLNVIQTSARDINLTARQATSTLATSQLVTVDGRSVYLDFFGLVLWDLVPSPTSGEIKQIEVVRGPASVVWGANAVNGVVNIITKTPRENEGFGLVLGGGVFDRDGGSRESDGNGYQFNGSFSYAKAINETWSYRLNAGYFNSDPYSRPTGTVPLDCHPLGVSPCRNATGGALPNGYPIGGAAYPADANQPGAFENDGTSQPKFGLRFDQDFTNGGRMTYEGGYFGTEGIVHTGIGPFRLESGSYGAFGRVVYTKNALKISAFANFLDAEAPNLLVSDPDTLGPIILAFKTQTYDLEVGNTNVLGGKHIFTYGGNLRQNNFDISLAQGDDRTEFGGYLHWEFFVDKFRFAAGARVDKFGNIEDPVFSPRVSIMFKPTPDHSIRRLVQPGVRLALVHQQLPEPEHPVPDAREPHAAAPAAAAAAAAARPAAFPADGERVRQLGDAGVVHGRLRGRLHGHVRQQDHRRAGRLPGRHRRQHQLHLHLPPGDAGLPVADVLQHHEPGEGRHGPDAHDARAADHAVADPDGRAGHDPAAVRRPDRPAGESRDVPEPGAEPQSRHRGVARPPLHGHVVGLRQLLLAGHARDPGRGLGADSLPGRRKWASRPSTASTWASATRARPSSATPT